MKFVIFGGSGRTGQVLCRLAQQHGHDIIAPSHADCDLLQAEAVSDFVLQQRVDAVINCAAISGLEACGDDPLQAHLINAVAPAAMALACRHTGARFIHLSTDYVLDGRRPGLKNESYKCRPEGMYPESKREGELQVLEANADSIVARVSWICGNPSKPAFVESLLTKAIAGQDLAAIADKFSLPTDAEDIARIILQLPPSQLRGIIHLCSTGEPLSWWDCATIALQEAAALHAIPAMPPPQRQQLDQVTFFREPRPRHTAMQPQRLIEDGFSLPSGIQCIQTVTRRFLASLPHTT